MDQGHFKFLAGKGIINPDLSFGSEGIPLFISPIKKRVIDLMTNLITIHDPDIITVPLSIIVAVNTFDTFFVGTTEQKNNTDTK
jgi:hypothetical protein